MALITFVHELPSREELETASLGRVVFFVRSISHGGVRLSDSARLDRARFMEDAANRLAQGILDLRHADEERFQGSLDSFYHPPGGRCSILNIPDVEV